MKHVLVEKNRYFDSVFLMRISKEIEELPGILQAVVAMATPMNVENLHRAGFSASELSGLSPQDLTIAIESESQEAADAARDRLEALLAGTVEDEAASDVRPSTLGQAVEALPGANLALISVPGAYAAREARMALQAGLHVMVFSDNVSVEDEIALKDEAVERGLLMIGPDCGTAMINGEPLGFANAFRPVHVGIVGASGTGIQEIASLIHRYGGGISQAIGTGGRDLSSAVGGRMTRFGIRALSDDPATRILVVVSKAPAPEVGEQLIEELEACGKPAFVHYVAAPPVAARGNVHFATTLAEAAQWACEASGLSIPASPPAAEPEGPSGQGSIHGFFCGGTLCQEAWSILAAGGLDVRSNVATHPDAKVHPEASVQGHVLWDLGDDAFTVGRPHPMIEPSLRDERVTLAGADPAVGVILVDCVIGYGAHENPAGSLAEAAKDAFAAAHRDGRRLRIVASITGTDRDPQDYRRQRTLLETAGAEVAESNADAAARVLAWTRPPKEESR